MTSKCVFLLALSALAATSAINRPACAAPSVQLVYDVPEDCPTEAEFVATTSDRGGRFEAPSSNGPLDRISVLVKKNGRSFSGNLSTESRGVVSAPRQLQGTDCVEVVRGLAVVAAIALGATEPSAPEDPVVSETAREEDVSPGRASAPSQSTPATGIARRRLRSSSFERLDTVPVRAGTMHFDRVSGYTLSAGAAFGLVPVVLPRFDFAVSGANFVTPPGGPSHIVGPVLRVRWSFLGPGTVHSGDYSTDVIGISAGLASCAAFTYDVAGLKLLGCSELGVAWMNLETRDATGTTTQSKDTGLGTVAVELNAEYSVAEHWHVGLRLGGQMQFGGVSAERPDNTRLFEAPLFSGYALGSVGMHFW